MCSEGFDRLPLAGEPVAERLADIPYDLLGELARKLTQRDGIARYEQVAR